MSGDPKRWLCLLGAALVLSTGRANADAALPGPSAVQSLSAHPAKVALKGADDAAQLIVTASLAGRVQDLTTDVQYAVADPKVAKVTAAGRVIPLGNGSTTVTARFGDKAVQVPVTCASVDENLPINFANQV